MLTFSPLRTPRLQVNLRELKASDAIALCQLSPDEAERGTFELLEKIVLPADAPRVGQVTDHRLWTVQERALVTAHYLAHLYGGDFAIGDGRYSDYLTDPSPAPPPPPVGIGELGDWSWSIQPMLGWHAESIERLMLADELSSDRRGWLIGAMAAQVYTDDEGPIGGHDQTDALIDAAVKERAEKLVALPESLFMGLLARYYESRDKLDHIFLFELSDDGVVWLPKQEEPGLPPARFPFSLAVREDTREVFGADGGGHDRTDHLPVAGHHQGWGSDPE